MYKSLKTLFHNNVKVPASHDGNFFLRTITFFVLLAKINWEENVCFKSAQKCRSKRNELVTTKCSAFCSSAKWRNLFQKCIQQQTIFGSDPEDKLKSGQSYETFNVLSCNDTKYDMKEWMNELRNSIIIIIMPKIY